MHSQTGSSNKNYDTNTASTNPLVPATGSLTLPDSAMGYEQITRYREGGMGVVFTAVDPKLKRTVALKLLRAEHLSVEQSARFHREAAALGQLRHPNILRIHQLMEIGSHPCMVLDFVPGGTLEDKLEGGPIASGDAARLVAILARAVQAAHDAGVVHRDLKPSNVLMAPPIEGSDENVLDSIPIVSDFGLARLAESDSVNTAAGIVMGTPFYMAPEQARGDLASVGPPCDVWALGVILYRCLAGRLPFAGDTILETLERVKNDEPPPSLGKGGEAFNDICRRCLNKDPAVRPTARELGQLLKPLVASAPIAPAVSTPTSPRSKARIWLPAVALVLVVVAVTLLTPPLWKRWTIDRSPPRIKSFTVRHFEIDGKKVLDRGVIGETSFAARHGDAFEIEAEFHEPAYLYLLTFNADGTKQLLWPLSAELVPDPQVRPLRGRGLKFPAEEGRLFALDDHAGGGWQVLAVLVSRNPLPSWTEWKGGRKLSVWKLAGGTGVFGYDRDGLFRLSSEGKRRVGENDEGVPPLEALAEELAGDGTLVKMLAFPVLPRRK